MKLMSNVLKRSKQGYKKAMRKPPTCPKAMLCYYVAVVSIYCKSCFSA